MSVSGGLAERSSNNPSKQIWGEFETTPDRSMVHSRYSELAKLPANLLFPFVGPLVLSPSLSICKADCSNLDFLINLCVMLLCTDRYRGAFKIGFIPSFLQCFFMLKNICRSSGSLHRRLAKVQILEFI